MRTDDRIQSTGFCCLSTVVRNLKSEYAIPMAKTRLDVYLTEQCLAASRSQAKALVMAGRVRVDGQVVLKAGMPIPVGAKVTVEAPLPYVSRGGAKLAAALEAFPIDPRGRICADVGASTGGFTDVLLQRGAARVYAIDVGYGQLAWKLRQDERVIAMERTNARHLTSLPELISMVTVDASFISLKLLLPAILKWYATTLDLIVLVKPQFEAGQAQVGKGGVVRDPMTHRQVLWEIADWLQAQRGVVVGLMPSPLIGPAGNREFLLYAVWGKPGQRIDLQAAIERCVNQRLDA